MKKEKLKLTTREINALVAAHREMKKAEKHFRELRDKLCKELPDGQFITDEGVVAINTFPVTKTNYKDFLEENPKLAKKIEKYIKIVNQTSITVKSTKGE